MSDENITTIFSVLLLLGILVSSLIGILLVYYVAIHDSVGVEVINIGQRLADQGLVEQIYINAMVDVLTISEKFPNYLDDLFFGMFSFVVITLIIGSYHLRRIGYFSLFGVTILGSIMYLFLLTFYSPVAVFIKDLLFNMVPTVVLELPKFLWYLENLGVINMVIMFICIIVNFVDFDFSRFNSRKNKDMINDEI